MTAKLIPYGRLEDGQYGVLLDDISGNPQAVVVEIVTNRNSETNNNFIGRVIYETTSSELYIWSGTEWESFRKPVTVTSFAPDPGGSAFEGSLHWDKLSQKFYIHDGAVWQLAGGRVGIDVKERTYIGNGSTRDYDSGLSSASNNYVEVFLDGVRQIPDYVNDAGQTVQGNYRIESDGTVLFADLIDAGVSIYIRTGEPVTITNISYQEEIYNVKARNSTNSTTNQDNTTGRIRLPNDNYSFVTVDTDNVSFSSTIHLDLGDLIGVQGRKITIADIGNNAGSRDIRLYSGSSTELASSRFRITTANGTKTLVYLGTIENNAVGWHVIS